MDKSIYKLNNIKTLKIGQENLKDKYLIFPNKKKIRLSGSEINELNGILNNNNNKSSRNKKNNFKNNFLLSSKLNLSENENSNPKNNDYLFKNRNIRNKLFSNPTITRITSEKFNTLKSSISDIEEGNSRTNYFSYFSFENKNSNSNENSTKSLNSIHKINQKKNSLNNSFQKKIKKTLTLNSSFIKKKNDQTIINIYNTSVNNSPNIYLLNHFIPNNNEKTDKSVLLKINDYFSKKIMNSNFNKQLSLKGFKVNQFNSTKKIFNRMQSDNFVEYKKKKDNLLKNILNKKKQFQTLRNFSDTSNSSSKIKSKKNYKLKRSESQKIYQNNINIHINNFMKKNIQSKEIYIENKELRNKLEKMLNKNFNIFNPIIDELKVEKQDFIDKSEKYIQIKLNSDLKDYDKNDIVPLNYKKYYKEIYKYFYKILRHSGHKFEKLYLSHIYKLHFFTRLQSYVLSIFMPQTLINHYFDAESYDGMIEFYLDDTFDDIPKNSSIKLIKEISKTSSKEINFKFIYEKFIQNDLQDVLIRKKLIEEIKFENEHAIRLLHFHMTRQGTKSFTPRFRNNLNKKDSLKKKAIFRKSIFHHNRFSNYMKNSHKKMKIISSSILNKEIFIRKNDKINFIRQNSYIRNLKLIPKRNVQCIKFNIDDPVESMKKNKNMSKEGLIFRTEEIKFEMKKKLKTFEEILFFLIKENNFREFKEILERFQISLESRKKDGSTLFMYAVECGYEVFINYLLQKGSDINAKNNINETALHIALRNHNYKFADLLIKHGANENIKNNEGLTPWQLC